MWKSNDKNVMTFALLNNKRALSLVELVVITFIIAIIATMAFPTYKIFQQRSKEKRLKKILTDVRAAINGSKSHNSTTDFEEGFRTVARLKGMDKINDAAAMWTSDPAIKQNCISSFSVLFSQGYGYPAGPKDIWSRNPTAVFPEKISGFYPAISPFDEVTLGNIPLERPFYRNCDRRPEEGIASGPVHPFHDWYQSVEFHYVPATDTNDIAVRLESYTYDQWYSNDFYPGLKGVKDIVSRGAGLALDGSNTDDW